MNNAAESTNLPETGPRQQFHPYQIDDDDFKGNFFFLSNSRQRHLSLFSVDMAFCGFQARMGDCPERLPGAVLNGFGGVEG